VKNAYKTRGDVTVILAKTRTGYVPFTIDTADLPRLQELGGTWYLFPKGGKVFVRAKRTKDGSQPLLHRFITGAEPGTVTAFKDGNPLNCRRANLVTLQPGEEIREPQLYVEPPVPIEDEAAALESALPQQKPSTEYVTIHRGDVALQVPKDQLHLPRNKQKALPPFPGPYPRGVHWHSTKKRWEVLAYWEGKRYHLGRFAPDEYEIAVKRLEHFRKHGPKGEEKNGR
jgi:hypothetical protein